jgi:hypothetical protein
MIFVALELKVQCKCKHSIAGLLFIFVLIKIMKGDARDPNIPVQPDSDYNPFDADHVHDSADITDL